MKASELYSLEPESTSKCLGVLKGFYYDHLPEVDEDYPNLINFYGNDLFGNFERY